MLATFAPRPGLISTDCRQCGSEAAGVGVGGPARCPRPGQGPRPAVPGGPGGPEPHGQPATVPSHRGCLVGPIPPDGGLQVGLVRTELALAPRFFASTETCSACGWRSADMSLADRVFQCQGYGRSIDRDLNAAVNVAAWAEHASASQAPDPQVGGRVTHACGGNRTGRHLGGSATGPETVQDRTKKQEPARTGRSPA
jgi:ribosomal protein L37E